MIVLVGFMGAGKTTVGYLLAERLGIPFVDVDRLIETRECCSISQIFAEHGEETFRRIEHETVNETLNGPDAVVALGGGAVEHPGTLLALDSAFVVYLEVEYDEAVIRIGKDHDRPMMSNPHISEIYLSRVPLYGRVSNLAIRTGDRRPVQIVGDIISKITTAT